MKKSIINEKKLKNIVNSLFIKEAIGQTIFDKLDEYPEIQAAAGLAAELLYAMMVEGLDNTPEYLGLHKEAELAIEALEDKCSTVEGWTKSPLLRCML